MNRLICTNGWFIASFSRSALHLAGQGFKRITTIYCSESERVHKNLYILAHDEGEEEEVEVED